MDILLKQRLIGAIVLISLAVIFIPMLFSGKGEVSDEKFDSKIPPEPTYEIKSPQVSVPLDLPAKTLPKVPLIEPEAQEDDSKPSSTEVVVANEIAVEEVAKKQVEAPAKTPATSPATLQASTSQTKVETSNVTQPTSSSKTEKTVQMTSPSSATPELEEKTALLAPEIKPKPSEVTGWVVQVGSFSNKANAVKLRDKLRKLGMTSFVVTGQSNKGDIYRVRVGPEINRTDAEKLQAQIKQKTKLNGLVMKYP